MPYNSFSITISSPSQPVSTKPKDPYRDFGRGVARYVAQQDPAVSAVLPHGVQHQPDRGFGIAAPLIAFVNEKLAEIIGAHLRTIIVQPHPHRCFTIADKKGAAVQVSVGIGPCQQRSRARNIGFLGLADPQRISPVGLVDRFQPDHLASS